MKSINKLKFLFNRSLLLLAIISMASCQPDKDENPSPGNNNNGGSSGDIRDQMIGDWVCQENSTINGTSGFTVKITKNTNISNGINMDNFYNIGFGNITVSTINGSNISIASQTVSGYVIDGTGFLTAANKMNLNYTVEYGNLNDSCTATLTKQ